MMGVKQELIDRAVRHREADEVVQGFFWKDGKGCCVGCLAETADDPHRVLSGMTGVPEWVFRLADKIHEGLPEGVFEFWPERFARALPDEKLSDSQWVCKLHEWGVIVCDDVLRHEGVWREHDKDDVYASKFVNAVKRVRDLCARVVSGGSVSDAEWREARSAVGSAVDSEWWSAARYAVDVVRSVADSALYAASSAVGSVADSALYAASSAVDAARSVARYAEWRSAVDSAWERYANKLITLLQERRG